MDRAEVWSRQVEGRKEEDEEGDERTKAEGNTLDSGSLQGNLMEA